MDFNAPTIAGNYSTGYTDVIVAHQKDLAKWLDSSDVTVANPVAGLKRYNATNQVFERRNAGNTAWEELPLAYAKLASPAFTGTPQAPQAAADTNTAQIATCSFVLGQAGTATPLVNGTATPGTSARYSRQDHVHPTDTTRAPLASPNFTGSPTVNGSTIWHTGNLNPANYAPLSGASFTGSISVAGNVQSNTAGVRGGTFGSHSVLYEYGTSSVVIWRTGFEANRDFRLWAYNDSGVYLFGYTFERATGAFMSPGPLKGNGGGLGLGQISVTTTSGTPTGGTDGDLVLVY